MEQTCHGTLLRFLAVVQFLSLDFAWFMVVNGDGTDGIAVCWNCAVSCCVCLQRADDHVMVRISVSGCNDEGVVLLVRVSWCKRWSLHTCPPSFAGKLKTMRREVFARFLRITNEQHELLGSRRDEHFILHLESCYCMKYNSHVWIVNLSSSSALRWTLAPAADSSSCTQLVRNSFTCF